LEDEQNEERIFRFLRKNLSLETEQESRTEREREGREEGAKNPL